LGLIAQEENGAYRTYHYDLRGSTVAITDESGSVTDRFQYDPYGKLVHRSGSTSTYFLFNGHDGVITDENGLLYMRARYYNPEIRRFLSKDPVPGDISNPLSLHPYAYCESNPVSKVDPEGLWGKEEHYKMTYDIATSLRIKTNMAAAIARGNKEMDEPPYWSPNPNYWFIHFNTRRETFKNPEAQRLYSYLLFIPPDDTRWEFANQMFMVSVSFANKGKYQEAAQYLGRALHALQDIGAHLQLSPVEHLYLQNEIWVDQTWAFPERYEFSKKLTEQFIRRFLKVTNKGTNNVFLKK
jgi:RHS repeat-associated protein